MKYIDAEELAERLAGAYEGYQIDFIASQDDSYYYQMVAIDNLAASYGLNIHDNLDSPNFIICDVCGEGIITPDFTNECDCGTLYNFAGQMLKPRDEWEGC